MPKIEIKERDLTQASGTVGTDIPYIPGFSVVMYEYTKTTDTTWDSTKDYYIINKENATGFSAAGQTEKDLNKLYERGDKLTPSSPVLCSSISQFEALFGHAPIAFKSPSTTYNINCGDFDRSYIMAKELLARNMSIYYHAIVTQEDIDKLAAKHPTEKFISELSTYLDKEEDDGNGLLTDKDEYTIKYLTSGGYHNYKTGVDTKLLKIASERGDCVALIEDTQTHTFNPNSDDCFWKSVCDLSSISSEYDEFGAAFTPWAYYTPAKKYGELKEILMPACFGYLLDLAVNIKTSPNWLAMAGTTRGIVPAITRMASSERLSNMIANKYQPTLAIEGTRAINAITNIKPYGLTIWGNRTLQTIGEEGLTATTFLNTRNMISDIKKVAYRAAKAQLFEQNSEVLWLNFKSAVSPFLDQLKSGNGISDYKLLKLDTKYDGSSLGKEEFACAIKIYPLYAVESFEINVVILDNDVSVG